MVVKERDQIIQEVLVGPHALSSLLKTIVDMRLDGQASFVEHDVLRQQRERENTFTASQRENLRKLRQHVTQYYAMTPLSSGVRIAFDHGPYPFVPSFVFDYVDPRPFYRAACILGEQRTEPGIMAAIDELLRSASRSRGLRRGARWVWLK
jgi:hypothetical protein